MRRAGFSSLSILLMVLAVGVPVGAQRKAGTPQKVVTVTLVRWPYT